MEHALKALGEGRVAGYLVYFGSPEQRDLHGEYFTPDTEYHLDWYDRRPALYHHGLDKTVKAQPVGLITSVTKNDIGLWAEAQLAMHNEYAQSVYEMVEKGALGWSSGSIPHIVKVAQDGRIEEWPIVEGSLTPTPAEPRGTWITAKHYSEPTELVTAYKSLDLDVSRFIPADADTAKEAAPIEPPPASAVIENETSPIQQETKMDLQQMVSDILNRLAQAGVVSVSPEELAGIAQQLVTEMTPAAAAPEAAVDPAPIASAIASKATVLIKELTDKKAAAKAAYDALVNGAVEAAKAAAPATQQAPAFTGGIGMLQQNGNGLKSQVTDVRDMRYDHLTPEDLVFGAHILQRGGKQVSESFLKATAFKAAKASEAGKGVFGDYAVKSVLPAIKADEVLATNLNGYGQQWVGVAYENRLWEAVRENVMYQQMLSRGAMRLELPAGTNEIYIPTDDTDPVWYTMPELNDIETDERLPVAAKTSTPNTTRRSLTTSPLGARIAFTDIFEEDALFPLLPHYRSRMELTAQETLENVIFNGDTATGASTNINLIDGTPSVDSKGRGPAYLLLNGVLKLPLVTTTALSRDAGASFDEVDFLETLKLLPPAQQVAYDRLMFVVDPFTYMAALNITAFKTRDVFSNATIEGGKLMNVFGVDVFRSGFIGKANTAGKISATPANNTKGRLLVVRPDQLAFGFKRNVSTEVARDIDAQATVVVSTLRFGMIFRTTTSGAAVSYNVAV